VLRSHLSHASKTRASRASRLRAFDANGAEVLTMKDVNNPIGVSISRRTLMQALGAATAVVGFDATSGSWVSAAHASTHATTDRAFESLPALDGTLHLDAATRTEYARDFGDIVSEYPLAVLKAASASDIETMFVFARKHGIRVVGRGRGHTTYGQSQIRAGIVVDLTGLQTIHRIDGDRIVVDAGIRWNALLDATLAQGLTPPMLTDYIGQTVGGTLSVGGVGGWMFRTGAQVDNVIELDVVTGEGMLVTCSRNAERALFDAVLAGQGQVGLIVRATLKLVPATSRIRVFNLIYADLPTLNADLVQLIEDDRFDFLEAFAFPQPGGTWVHLLQAGSHYTPPAAPDNAVLLAGMNDIRAALGIDDVEFEAFAKRVPIDLPVQPHPWIDLILPYPQIETFVAEVERTLVPLAEGDSFQLLLIPMRTDRLERPLFRAPASKIAIQFGILRFMPKVQAAVDAALAYNRKLYDLAHSLGGTYYPISAVDLDRRDWVRHYGPQFARLVAAKRRYDPGNVLAGGPEIF
jgi:FAD/FMN-containing dehydrogenase